MLKLSLLLASLSGLLAMASNSLAERPNILFFFVDDMGWQDTSVAFHSQPTKLNEIYHTPNMQRLANKGLLFTNAYACAICSPSRVSLMTGQNAARHRVTCWTLRRDKSPEPNHPRLASAPWNRNGLQPVGANIPRTVEAVTLPQVLRDAGYRTIHAGKAHFGAKDTPGANPKNLGFDVNIAGHYAGGPGSYHGDKSFSAAWRNGGDLWDVPGLEKYHGQEINLTEAITREAIAAVEQAVADEKPFYLYMSHYAVHAPWEPDRRFIDKYTGLGLPKQQAVLASMLESMDQSLGDLMAMLDRMAVGENTIVVFMSDNGSHRNCPRNRPLRGHKISAYEGGSRVPMIVHWPGVTPEGKRTNFQVVIEDIFPTFLQMAGVALPADRKIDGVSFVPELSAPTKGRPPRPLFWHYPNYYDQPAFSSVIDGHWKLVYWHDDPRFDLYNLKTDLSEANNLAATEPDRVERLAKLLAEHLRKTDAVMPVIKATGESVPLPDEI